MAGRIGRLAGQVTDRVVQTVDPDVVLGAVDIDALLARVEINAVLDRVDVQRLLDRVDVDALMARVDVTALVMGVDLDRVLAGVDLDALLARVELDRVLARVDLTTLLMGVDVDRVLGTVDLDRVLAGVDLDAVLGRVDVNAVLDRVDVDRVLSRVDVAQLLERADVAALVRASTGDVAVSVLDRVRVAAASLAAPVDRSLGRGTAREGVAPGPRPQTSGPVARALGALADWLTVSGSFALGWAAAAVLVDAFTRHQLGSQEGLVAGAAFSVWWFVYTTVCVAVAGQTAGKWLAGTRVVRSDGTPVWGRNAVVRTLVFPLSCLLFGLGLVGIVVGRDHRALHDVASGTLVVRDDAVVRRTSLDAR